MTEIEDRQSCDQPLCPRLRLWPSHLYKSNAMQGNDTSVYLRQYKADGTVFWNHVFVAALRNSERKIINYVGIQHPLNKVRSL